MFRPLRSPVVVSVLVLAAGAGLLFYSHALTDLGSGEWWAGVLVNVGTSIFLAVPLVYLALLLERRIERGQQRTDGRVAALTERVETFEGDVERRLDEVTETLASRLAEERRLDADAFRVLSETPTRARVREALIRAYELDLIGDRRGPRVGAFEDADVFVRFDFSPERTVGWYREEAFGLTVEDVTGRAVGTLDWSEDVSLDDVFAEAGRFVQRGTSRGKDLDLTFVLRGLREALEVALSTQDRRPVLQLCPPQWAVTEHGIASYGDGRAAYTAGWDYLNAGRASIDLHAKGWVDRDSLDDALMAAAHLRPPDDPPF